MTNRKAHRTGEHGGPEKQNGVSNSRISDSGILLQPTIARKINRAAEILSAVKISRVWQALGGPALRHGRGPAFWRGGDGLSVSVNDSKGVWHDHAGGDGGGVLSLVARVRGGDRQESLKWLADYAGVTLDESPLSTEDKAHWAAERRAIEVDLPPARLWRRWAVLLGDQILTDLKAAITNPTADRPRVGEIADWERRLARWGRLDGAELVAEYNSERAANEAMVAALVSAAKIQQAAEWRALQRFLNMADPETAAA